MARRTPLHLGLPQWHGARRPFLLLPSSGSHGIGPPAVRRKRPRPVAAPTRQEAGEGAGRPVSVATWCRGQSSPERLEGAACAPSSTAAPPGIFLPAFARAAPPRRQARPAAPPLLVVVARSVIRGCSRRRCNTRNKGPRFPYYDIHSYLPFEPLYYNPLSRPPDYTLSNPRNYYRIGPPSPPGFP